MTVNPIEVINLVASYGNLQVLNGVSFHVEPGEFVGIRGRSGCGKSTLLHVLGGMHREFSGAVRVAGVDIGASSENELLVLRRQNLGFVFQQSFLISEMTLSENVEFPLLLQGFDKEERRHLVSEILERLDLRGCENQLPAELSGGQKQRGAIARAMISHPGVLLVDEPTGALDVSNGREVIEAIGNLSREADTAVLMVSHDEDVLSRVDRIIQLVDGRIEIPPNSSAS